MDLSDILTFGGIGFGIYYFVYGPGSAVTAFVNTDTFPITETDGRKLQHRTNTDGSSVDVVMLQNGYFAVQTMSKDNKDIKRLFYDKDGLNITGEEWVAVNGEITSHDLPKGVEFMSGLKSSGLKSSSLKSSNFTPYDRSKEPVASWLKPLQSGGGFVGKDISLNPPIVQPGAFSEFPATITNSPDIPGVSTSPVFNGYIVSPYYTIPNSTFGF